MNLDAFVSGAIGQVNPRVALTVRLSAGYGKDATYAQVPAYETPGSFTASVDAAGLMTVTAVAAGYLRALQTVSGGVAPGTVIARQTSGAPGGVGTYQLNIPQAVGSRDMANDLVLQGQAQPLQYKDLAQIDGLNLNGTRKKFYLYGVVQATVRALQRGGSLIVDPYGDTWLVAVVAEQWHNDGWCAIIATLQNGG